MQTFEYGAPIHQKVLPIAFRYGSVRLAGISLPKNNGDIVGIYSVYNYEKQLLLRDTSDILFRGKRCTGAAWLKN